MSANVILSWLFVYLSLPLSVHNSLTLSGKKKVFSQHYKNVLPTQSQAGVCVYGAAQKECVCVRDNIRGKEYG